jgi:hypothetical protein
MKWIRQDKGITKDGEVYIIPYPPPKLDHLPLGELVLLSGSFNLPQKITFEMKVDKLINIGVNAIVYRISQPKRHVRSKIVYLPKRTKSEEKVQK